jgi:uncharacterized membrane protein
MSTSNDSNRINSLDLVRGIVMILMAIDHVRVYSGVPAGSSEPAVFFTRWITHFVAPAFCFFAGTGAFFLGKKLNDTRALSRFLVSRGLILVVLELTLIRVFWTFNFDFGEYMLAGVIWMLGWCMVLMGGLVRFSTRAIGIFGLVVITGQQIMDPLGRLFVGPLGILHQFLYGGGGVGPLGILYVLVPWIGVMALGYAFGTLYTLEDAQRRRRMLIYGGAATAFFLIVGSLLAMGGGGGESGEGSDGIPFIGRLLNQRKYPASQLFLAMTLGPTIMFLPLAERLQGRRIWNWITTFGRVPMFYYLLHIPVIHVAAIIVSKVREGSVNPWLYGNHPYNPPELPPNYRWGLDLLYFVWAVCVVALYFPSAWYAKLKATRRHRWLSYI